MGTPGRTFCAVMLAGIVGACVGPTAPDAGPTPPASPQTARSPSPVPSRVTVLASGDVLVHDSVAGRARSNAAGVNQPFDFRPMFADVRPIVSEADLAICHLETPLSRDNTRLSYYPIFNVPRQVAPALADAGYDACSTASNHSLDRGFGGVAATLDVLDAAGMRHTGTARTAAEAATPALFEVEGVRVALLSYTYGLNGLPLPPGRPWAANLIDAERIVSDARAARGAGAEVVLLSLHWGAEYRTRPTAFQRGVASNVLRSGAVDVIFGHHAHVVQPIGRMAERAVIYGMGNHLSGQVGRCCPAGTEDGVMVRVTFEKTPSGVRVVEVGYVPTWVEPGTYRIVPVAEALANPATSGTGRRELVASWCRTTRALRLLGAQTWGVAPLKVPDPPPRC